MVLREKILLKKVRFVKLHTAYASVCPLNSFLRIRVRFITVCSQLAMKEMRDMMREWPSSDAKMDRKSGYL